MNSDSFTNLQTTWEQNKMTGSLQEETGAAAKHMQKPTVDCTALQPHGSPNCCLTITLLNVHTRQFNRLNVHRVSHLCLLHLSKALHWVVGSSLGNSSVSLLLLPTSSSPSDLSDTSIFAGVDFHDSSERPLVTWSLILLENDYVSNNDLDTSTCYESASYEGTHGTI